MNEDKDILTETSSDESTAESKTATQKPETSSGATKSSFKFKNLLDGSLLTREETLKHVPFFIFLFFLGIVLIANSYWVERMAKEVNILKKEMKELNFEEPATAAELLQLSKQSTMAEQLKSQGIQESVIPPFKIKVKKRTF